jgi:rifampicin phosphotransferase
MAFLFLDEVVDAAMGQVGAKAATLARLRRRGLPVPDGFVVPAEAALDERALEHALRRLGGPVAVRSSSTAEDMGEASFAGQYQTVLGVIGAAAVAEAARACRASAAAAAGYARTLGVGEGRMAVLVQRLVEPRAAGVAFTRHPRDEGSLLVESVAGRGDTLVSGHREPDRYTIDRASGTLRDGPLRGSLDQAALHEVVALARRVEDTLGSPQDVEWALGEAGPVLLQARPITVEPEEQLDPRVRRLTRANVGEVLPDPITPLTWTTVGAFLEHAFRSVAGRSGLLPKDPPPILVRYRQRLFLNLSLGLEIASRIPGLSRGDAERLLLGGGEGFSEPTSPLAGGRLRALGMAIRLLKLARSLPLEIAQAEALVAALPSRALIDASGPQALHRYFHRLAEDGRRVAATHVLCSGASGARLAVLGRLLAVFAKGDPTERVNRLVAGLDGVESAAPTLALEAMAVRIAASPEESAWLAATTGGPALWALDEAPPALAAELGRFLELHGHRALSEGELRAAAWEDDPAPVLAALRLLSSAARSTSFRRRAGAEARGADEEALLARPGPLGRALLRGAIRDAQRGVREREHTKSLTVGLARHGRRLVRAAARQLVRNGVLRAEDDVFFLEWDELLRMLQGGKAPAPALLARRQRRFEREGALAVPHDVDLGVAGEAAREPRAADAALVGTGVSGGVGRGRARVVGPGMVPDLEPGEVLVATVLDAALGPLLASAAGAVAEIGGLLSHGAVVARELGVPCVVDVHGATERIRTGDTILVDGSTGTVEVVHPNARHQGLRGDEPRSEALAVEDATLEAMHAGVPSSPARESLYCALQDPIAGLRLIATEGAHCGGGGESLLALALPDGRALFGLDLAPATVGPHGLAVGGVRAGLLPPTLKAELRLAPHEGAAFPPGLIPLLLAPRTIRVRIDLTFHPTTPVIDFCRALPAAARDAVRPLGDHHLEQSGSWTGTIEVQGRSYAVAATGHRDHSWGRREWSALDHSRLFVAHFGDDLTVHALALQVNGRRVQGGFVWRRGRAERVVSVLYTATRRGGRLETVDVEVQPADGPPLRLRGVVERALRVPVSVERRPGRHLLGRPYALLLDENFVRYETEGRVGYGMAEISERPC